MRPDMAGGLSDVGESLHGLETRRSLLEGIDFADDYRWQIDKNDLRIMV
ncbi:MAG: hypothetical protein QNL14_09680 [Deltaproteobacteria bacterium]|nr:hypothetical protein [Deltaproteobacteria bacterium]